MKTMDDRKIAEVMSLSHAAVELIMQRHALADITSALTTPLQRKANKVILLMLKRIEEHLEEI